MQSLQKCGACLRAFVAFDERRRPPAFRTAAFANRLASGKEAALTGAVVGVLYFVGKLAGIFSLLGLAYTAVLAAFTLPKVRIPRKGSFAALFGGLLRRVCGCNVGLGTSGKGRGSSDAPSLLWRPALHLAAVACSGVDMRVLLAWPCRCMS